MGHFVKKLAILQIGEAMRHDMVIKEVAQTFYLFIFFYLSLATHFKRVLTAKKMPLTSSYTVFFKIDQISTFARQLYPKKPI